MKLILFPDFKIYSKFKNLDQIKINQNNITIKSLLIQQLKKLINQQKIFASNLEADLNNIYYPTSYISPLKLIILLVKGVLGVGYLVID